MSIDVLSSSDSNDSGTFNFYHNLMFNLDYDSSGHTGFASTADLNSTVSGLSSYVLVDGSRGFTGTVSGITPIQLTDLATKGYIDGEIATLSGSIVLDHGSLTGLSDDNLL